MIDLRSHPQGGYDPFMSIGRRKGRKHRKVARKKKATPGAPPPNTMWMVPPKEADLPPTPVKVATTPAPVKGLTQSQAQEHKNVNKALQEELKTKQEELRARKMEKELAAQDTRQKNDKAQRNLAGATAYLLWGTVLVGAMFAVKTLFFKGEG